MPAGGVDIGDALIALKPQGIANMPATIVFVVNLFDIRIYKCASELCMLAVPLAIKLRRPDSSVILKLDCCANFYFETFRLYHP